LHCLTAIGKKQQLFQLFFKLYSEEHVGLHFNNNSQYRSHYRQCYLLQSKNSAFFTLPFSYHAFCSISTGKISGVYAFWLNLIFVGKISQASCCPLSIDTGNDYISSIVKVTGQTGIQLILFEAAR